MQLCIALGMAELASAYPTSGCMYYWQFKLAGERWGPLACWLTGQLCEVAWALLAVNTSAAQRLSRAVHISAVCNATGMLFESKTSWEAATKSWLAPASLLTKLSGKARLHLQSALW